MKFIDKLCNRILLVNVLITSLMTSRARCKAQVESAYKQASAAEIASVGGERHFKFIVMSAARSGQRDARRQLIAQILGIIH